MTATTATEPAVNERARSSSRGRTIRKAASHMTGKSGFWSGKAKSAENVAAVANEPEPSEPITIEVEESKEAPVEETAQVSEVDESADAAAPAEESVAKAEEEEEAPAEPVEVEAVPDLATVKIDADVAAPPTPAP